MPENIYDVRQIACGSNHVLALKNNGEVVAWGSNQKQTDILAIKLIATGNSMSAALSVDNKLILRGPQYVLTIFQ